jgi:SAM-dependent methyltransferase
MPPRDLLKDVERFYSEKVARLGATPAGADYNSPEAQTVRFDQLARLLDRETGRFSLNDYGCGYGALGHYLAAKGLAFDNVGADISAEMLAAARERMPPGAGWTFLQDPAQLAPADYTIACGIFNLRFSARADDWTAYVLETLDHVAAVSRRGFAFNMLTKYSDADRMKDNLYYGDPLFFFERARKFSRNVALLHDYGLYDFTILVRLP